MKFKTIKEWLLCLVSRRHAQNTWLRIDGDAERRTLKWMDRFVCGIIGGVVIMLGVAVYQYMFYRNMQIIKYKDATVYIKYKGAIPPEPDQPYSDVQDGIVAEKN